MKVQRQETRKRKTQVEFSHEDIEKILQHHVADLEGFGPEDVTVNLEGGDALCRATVTCIEEVDAE